MGWLQVSRGQACLKQGVQSTIFNGSELNAALVHILVLKESDLAKSIFSCGHSFQPSFWRANSLSINFPPRGLHFCLLRSIVPLGTAHVVPLKSLLFVSCWCAIFIPVPIDLWGSEDLNKNRRAKHCPVLYSLYPRTQYLCTKHKIYK